MIKQFVLTLAPFIKPIHSSSMRALNLRRITPYTHTKYTYINPAFSQPKNPNNNPPPKTHNPKNNPNPIKTNPKLPNLTKTKKNYQIYLTNNSSN